MWVYILVFLWLLLLSIRYDINNYQKGRDKWVRIVVLFFILFAGLRHRIGADTINYMFHFSQTPSLFSISETGLELSTLTQPLWFLINSFFKTIYDDFLFVQLFHAIVFNLLFFRYIRRKTEKFFITTLILYCLTWWNLCFEVLRESLCVALFLNATLCLEKGNVKKYVLICIPAFFIHYLSFVVIIFTLVAYLLNKKVLTVALILVIVVMIIFIDNIFQILMTMAMTSPEGVSERVEELILNGNEIGNLNIYGLIQLFIILIAPAILYIFYNKSKDVLSSKLLILFVFFSVTTSFIVLLSRFLNYLLPIYIVFTVNYLTVYRKEDIKRFLVLGLTCLRITIAINGFYKPLDPYSTVNYDYRYIPYKTIFQDNDPVRERHYSGMPQYTDIY